MLILVYVYVVHDECSQTHDEYYMLLTPLLLAGLGLCAMLIDQCILIYYRLGKSFRVRSSL